MTYYGATDLADSFRTVRRNTIQIAEDIPEDKYGFRPTPDSRSVAEELAHIACSSLWQAQAHGSDHKTFITFADFGTYMGRVQAEEKALTTKAAILDALRSHGDAFAGFLHGLSDATLAESVGFPPPIQPPSKTRFEMLLGVKEHEMHHRAKLMVTQRLMGIVPHLTRAREQRMQEASAGAKS